MSIKDLQLLIRLVSKKMRETPVSDPDFDNCVRIYNILNQEIKRVYNAQNQIGKYP